MATSRVNQNVDIICLTLLQRMNEIYRTKSVAQPPNSLCLSFEPILIKRMVYRRMTGVPIQSQYSFIDLLQLWYFYWFITSRYVQSTHTRTLEYFLVEAIPPAPFFNVYDDHDRLVLTTYYYWLM